MITWKKKRCAHCVTNMICKFTNKECPYAGRMFLQGYKELGEKEGLHEYAVCYKDMSMDPTKCKES